MNVIATEVIPTWNQRVANHVHQGWSARAIATISPWTSSRIHATNQHNPEGAWITRRTRVVRLRVQVSRQDLAPVPGFVAAIEEALGLSTKFERFRAVYSALSNWGDVVPLEIEIGSSLSLTDTEAGFAKLPVAASYNSFSYLSTIKIPNVIRKGAISNSGWGDGTWVTGDVPPIEWQLIRVITVVPTINLLTDNLQAQLTELYAEMISYVPPLLIDAVGWLRKIHDDTVYTSRTISSVKIRNSDYIECLAVTYLDGVTTEGGGKGGIEHTFTLANGEHIIEMLTGADKDTLRGIQFITNTGRCSSIHGRLEGTPVISRSRGGILSGLVRRTRIDNDGSELLTGVRGIWRYDFMPRVPKENDVYSEYFGAKIRGSCFNDRTLVGNSSSMHISCIEVWAGVDIGSIQLTYRDTKNDRDFTIKTARHGGTGGNYHKFDLEDGEYIVSASGKHNEQVVTQLCFGVNTGRASHVYGGGDGHQFSAKAPIDENGKYSRLQYMIGKGVERDYVRLDPG
ncbi:unnamed protein product [Rhizoctonia solani]|uniref:Jacalin-type lectin domain-containing protein n=1 Tax=Rhizoctonia solani TaxID=456999 RepID=A0A8H3DQK0_9AGAM|nr:unnamed protein product [Rhizoctonia solani]